MLVSAPLIAHDKIADMRWCGLHAVWNESVVSPGRCMCALYKPLRVAIKQHLGLWSSLGTAYIYSSVVSITTCTRECMQCKNYLSKIGHFDYSPTESKLPSFVGNNLGHKSTIHGNRRSFYFLCVTTYWYAGHRTSPGAGVSSTTPFPSRDRSSSEHSLTK